MKKYKVLREMPGMNIGDVIQIKDLNIIYPSSIHTISADRLAYDGWLAEVPEEKELWEKLIDYKDDHYVADTYWMNKAKIARQHFAEVARKARDSYNSYKIGEAGKVCSDFIIQAIESYGEK